ncbi:hypothetical protein IFR05_006320 [Cadophora sp. M221]|nr:hypothetical protein IFR05_006320 [Cadophora sp. M221]
MDVIRDFKGEEGVKPNTDLGSSAAASSNDDPLFQSNALNTNNSLSPLAMAQTKDDLLRHLNLPIETYALMAVGVSILLNRTRVREEKRLRRAEVSEPGSGDAAVYDPVRDLKPTNIYLYSPLENETKSTQSVSSKVGETSVPTIQPGLPSPTVKEEMVHEHKRPKRQTIMEVFEDGSLDIEEESFKEQAIMEALKDGGVKDEPTFHEVAARLLSGEDEISETETQIEDETQLKNRSRVQEGRSPVPQRTASSFEAQTATEPMMGFKVHADAVDLATRRAKWRTR